MTDLPDLCRAMSGSDREAWAERVEELPPDERPALIAWVDCGEWIDDNAEPLRPDLDAFHGAFCGRWDTFVEFARYSAEEGQYLEGMTDEQARYFDYERWARDICLDYAVEDAPGGNVYVFRCL